MQTHPLIQALIFDFDGLLVDTETPALESWRLIYAEHGHELPLAVWQGALGTAHGFDALTYLEQLNGRPFAEPLAVRERRQQLKAELSAPQPLLPGVLPTLASAEALGLSKAVASSSTREWVNGWLARHEILGRFLCVRTADDVALTKPAPDLFLAAAACLGVSPDVCLVFEDSPNGILAARAAQMRVVAVPGAVTRQVALPPADLTLASLDALPLQEVLARIEGG
jgi:HAD superfamily hydrolase (TIGR01509 family)